MTTARRTFIKDAATLGTVSSQCVDLQWCGNRVKDLTGG
jgi:hypothetical protein